MNHKKDGKQPSFLFLKNILTNVYAFIIIKQRGVVVLINQQEQIAEKFRALGDENRILIITILKTGERCANEILEELDITQPTLSHHMKILCESELVEQRKEGKKIIYSLSYEKADRFLSEIRELFQIRAQRRHDDDIVIL